MKQLEHAEQVSLIKWWALSCRRFSLPEASLFAIPNGGDRNIVVAAKLKAEGVRAGVPDLFLAVPCGGFSGLFIELKKAKGGRASDKQKGMLDALASHGYDTAVCHGWLAARNKITAYLKG